MTTTPFTALITDESQLRDVFGWPSARAVNKQIDRLDQHCRAIMAQSPFLLLGTSDTTGKDLEYSLQTGGFGVGLSHLHTFGYDELSHKNLFLGKFLEPVEAMPLL
jgi:hypothetical protein